MEVDTDDDLLRTLAAGGSIDNTHWPRVLNTLVSRIEFNCYNRFAAIVIPKPKRTQSVLPDWSSTVPDTVNTTSGNGVPLPLASGTAAQDVDKENTKPDAARASTEEVKDAPSSADKEAGSTAGEAADDGTKDSTAAACAPASASDEATSSAMPPPPVPAKAADVDGADDKSAPDAAADKPPVMPKPAVELLDYITSHLKDTFPKYPPHSIQRLAELVVFPHQHYRYLGPYLGALERVVSVTSGCNRYPLPSELPPSQAAILNGTADTAGKEKNGANGHNGTNGTGGGDDDDDKRVNDQRNGNSSAPADAGQEWSSDTSWGALLTPIPWLRGQQPNNTSTTDDDRSTTEEAGGDGGSSPLDGSDDDGSEMAFSTTSSTVGLSLNTTAAGASVMGSLRAGTQSPSRSPSRSPSPSLQPSPLSLSAAIAQPTLQSQAQPPQRRLEVRTEATETIDGPNGAGGVETVSVSINGIASHGAAAAAVVHLQQRGITQGELLRQEQKAGVVPVSQLARAAAAARAAADGRYSGRFMDHDDDDDDADDDEDHDMDDGAPSRVPFAEEAGAADAAGAVGGGDDTAMGGTKTEAEAAAEAEAEAEAEEAIPHARGPRALGAADMGPQPSTSSTSAPGLQIGTAADDSAVHTVHMGEMNLESAVGRAAAALPVGTVAAPLVPASIVASTEAVDTEDAVPAGSAPTSVLSPARATTPKREADRGLDGALPAKKRKGDIGDDGVAEDDKDKDDKPAEADKM